MLVGLVLGLAGSVLVGRAAHDHTLAGALPLPWVTASLGLAVLAVGWVLSSATPRVAAGLAAGALPGAVYAASALAGDGERQLAYGWSAILIALGGLTLGAGLHASRSHTRPWSARRRTASRVPRARLR